ncbi:hypothetical protein [Kibdelosporangium phytohabitans]|uniref:Uncharacterized protein n=1 Tax=Kibdelosporangium phytohabitans TaxID=860235 RepID=A0A0N9I3T8_9PSEU|nr:hypothetical protein [Kibdelosporangium phytohabitans]ALG12524.1 hypothetical protein AOZ06_41730 [Kibdelosporangium phytohabitans]MBE1464127.1 hypothetical protein [Kibdelosporangium phytohabitans]
MLMFVDAGVANDVPIAMSMRRPDDPVVSIMFGGELITLEFFDVASLERLSDLAAEGARRLRGAIETGTEAEAARRSAPTGG